MKNIHLIPPYSSKVVIYKFIITVLLPRLIGIFFLRLHYVDPKKAKLTERISNKN